MRLDFASFLTHYQTLIMVAVINDSWVIPFPTRIELIYRFLRSASNFELKFLVCHIMFVACGRGWVTRENNKAKTQTFVKCGVGRFEAFALSYVMTFSKWIRKWKWRWRWRWSKMKGERERERQAWQVKSLSFFLFLSFFFFLFLILNNVELSSILFLL